MLILAEISEAVQEGRSEELVSKTREALAQGVTAERILNDGLLIGMGVVGTKFKNNEIYVPEMLIAARAMGKSLEVLEPELVAAGVEPVGKVVLGTVKGDLHDIGKNLVNMMMTGAGLEVIDLGIDVSAETFIEAIELHKPEVLALSCLLTTTMPRLTENIEKLAESGFKGQLKVLVGGAPVTQEFADTIGADAYAPDAASAAEVARQLVLEFK